ncbi:hypothetical protein [Corynebacterium sp. AOP12-C2-36]|uniref:hypothetical protein n=1 Tax=Corynebacterium sp. AOP12-C2-36 TaxID=3457723 RepID=UPI00403358F5
MPDQTPVTDDDRRTAYEWAASLDPDMRCWTDRERAAARVILATVPAPPATLADEIREEGAGRPPGAVKRVNALADRVETVEKARDKAQQDAVDAWEHAAQTDRDHVRVMGLWEQDYARVAKERDEARAEVERLTVSLNRQCTTVTPSVHNTDGLTVSSDALPDPADVPTNEPWEVVGPNGPAIGYRDGHEDLPWSVVHKDGNGCDDLSDGRVTLVARLVRRLVGPVEVVEE